MKRLLPAIEKILLMAVIALLMIFALIYYRQNHNFEYKNNLDRVVFTLDGEPFTYREMMFYIAYEERVVEEQARIYNSYNTRDYWNMHLGDGFVQTLAKQSVLNMAVHDMLFYNLAEDKSLTEEMDSQVMSACEDYWMDMLDGQTEVILSVIDDAFVRECMAKKAVGERCQDELAKAENHAFVYYNPDADGYKELMKGHTLKVEKSWEQFVIGNITLTHKRASGINGFDGRAREE